jgi:hypothetical protein
VHITWDNLPPRQQRGFMLVRNSRFVLEEYHKDPFIKRATEYLDSLRAVFNFLNPENYRGIDREPLSPVDEDKKEQEIIASTRFLELMNDRREEWFLLDDAFEHNTELINTMEQAGEIVKYLQASQQYEIIEIARDEFGSSFPILGFDVGYWAGDHFSLIGDSVVKPKWHSPDPKDWDELKSYTVKLNSNLLFNSVDEALEFKNFYISKEWAETESSPGEFCIIQVASAS